MQAVSAAVIAITGSGLVLFALLAVFRPQRAVRFLRGFAQSARAHYAELGIRLVVGASLVVHASGMRWPRVFELFGWVILATTAGLLLVPWTWHQRFAARVIPIVIRFLPLYAVANAALGGVLIYGVFAEWR